jgi:hypothetical protein
MRLWTNLSASGAEWTRSLIQRPERDLERDAKE